MHPRAAARHLNFVARVCRQPTSLLGCEMDGIPFPSPKRARYGLFSSCKTQYTQRSVPTMRISVSVQPITQFNWCRISLGRIFYEILALISLQALYEDARSLSPGPLRMGGLSRHPFIPLKALLNVGKAISRFRRSGDLRTIAASQRLLPLGVDRDP